MKVINKYTFYARYIPGLITLLPISLIYFFTTQKYSGYSLTEYFQSITFVAGISGVFVVTYFTSMIVREFGSYLENRYFKSRDGFPTTYLMLYENSLLPRQVKVKYNEKIKSDFGIVRMSEVNETNNRSEAIKILTHATRLLSTRYQQDKQVTEANIAYGFSRNVCGGLLISLPCSIAGIIVGVAISFLPLIFWSTISFVIYLLIAIVHKQWILRNAEKYAEKLFSIYLSN